MPDGGERETDEKISRLRKAVARDPRSLEANMQLGIDLANAGRLEEAQVYFRTAVTLAPHHPTSYNNLGLLLSKLGRHEEAVDEFEKALKLHPRFVPALDNLGCAFKALGRYDRALHCFEQALTLQPGSAAAHNNYGEMLAAMDRTEQAVDHFQKAIAADPGSINAYNNLGNALNVLDRPNEALAAFGRALARDGKSLSALLGTSVTQVYLGRVEEARRAIEQAIAIAPQLPVLYRALSDITKFRPGDPNIAALEEMANNEAVYSNKDQAYLHFALAKAYADLEDHARSFAHLEKGNAAMRRIVVYDEPGMLAALRDIAAVFTRDLIAEKGGAGDPSDAPVFIVGMPRSGTTLIEQILASHPDMFGAGETNHFGNAVAGGYKPEPLPFDVAGLSAEDMKCLGGRYLACILPKAPQAKRITDKLPNNFRFAGLIHLVLPNARIIHVRRDPLDTCFSCYAYLFHSGITYSYDQGELGRFYKAYAALMDHWRDVLPRGVMLEVQYEDLVGDIETNARRIVEFCGLEWDARCLAFHKNKRAVRTVSAHQVRQPLFTSSIGRAQPYAQWLGPLREALEG